MRAYYYQRLTLWMMYVPLKRFLKSDIMYNTHQEAANPLWNVTLQNDHYVVSMRSN
jgi:hypothetical protein